MDKEPQSQLSESQIQLINDELEYDYDANNYGEFMMEVSKNLVCEFCCDTENSTFYIKNLKFLCQCCVNGPDIAQPFPDSTFKILKVVNLPDCILHDYCDDKARWKCSKSGIAFCDTCHVKVCLLQETSSKKIEFQCSPECLFEADEIKCVVCTKIHAEFEKDDGSKLCHRCSSVTFNQASNIRISKDKSDRIIKTYSNLLKKSNAAFHSNALQDAKFKCYFHELKRMLEPGTSYKYLFPNGDILNQALDSSNQQIEQNESKLNKLIFVHEFLRKEGLIRDLIKNSAICIEEFQSLVHQLDDLVEENTVSYSIITFPLIPSISVNVCSQNSVSLYNSSSQESTSQADSESIDDQPESVDNEASGDTELEVYLDAPLKPFTDPSRLITDIVYFRDPNWIWPVVPGCQALRKEIFDFLNSNFVGKPLNASSICIGFLTVFRDASLKRPDGHPYKRGIIQRLPSEEGGTYCVASLDFARKLPVRLQYLFECPSELASKPATVFHARIMGVQPVSKFAYTKTQGDSAFSIMKGLVLAGKSKISIERLFIQGEFVYCNIYSMNNENILVNWETELIRHRAAVPFQKRNSCFLPKKDFCYLYHVLRQCNIRECNRVHECSFCYSRHRLVDCEAYLAAEKAYQIDLDDSNLND
ncbi:uncharacterized protein LOC112539246 isoform X1 [Tetranychus urticae]|uniref:uncharacterized protein LOC112539246 isoform X1 n=1 Tax=Tetranychus urticae TaxID=32264 RepID=UPI000D64B11B|nr:uncharacterized protein LOC112539246 isoform X1 [Tetranychus urticae]